MISIKPVNEQNTSITRAILPLLLLLATDAAMQLPGHQYAADKVLTHAITSITATPADSFFEALQQDWDLQYFFLIYLALQSNVMECYTTICEHPQMQAWLYDLGKSTPNCQ